MEMMVTSDSTVLMTMSSDTITGQPTRIKLLLASADGGVRRPTTRPTTRKMITGNRMVPNAPMGSRRNTLISIQVSFQSPRIILVRLVAYRVPGQFQKHVLEIRKHGTKIRHRDLIRREATNHFGHQIVTPANGQVRLVA